MTTINIASKANQATTIPALLVAQYAKEADSNASINVNFDEVEALKTGDKAAVELVIGNGTSSYGSEHVISELMSAYPFLQGKHVDSVRLKSPVLFISKLTITDERMVEQDSIILSYRFQVRRGAVAGIRCTSYPSIIHCWLHPYNRGPFCLGCHSG